MDLRRFSKQNRTGQRLMLLIIAFSSLVTLVLTVAQLVLDYRQQKGDMDRVLDDITVQLPTLAGIVWAFNEKQIDLSLEAIVRLPNIEQARIVASDGHGRWEYGNRRTSSHLLTRSYPLHRQVRNEERQIGTLEVVARLDGIYQRVLEHALSILLSNAIKTFLVAGFMLFIFNHYVTRRLAALTDDVHNLVPRLLTAGLPIEKPDPPAGSDELDELRWTFDAMAK